MSPRNLAIGGSAVVVLLLAIIFATRGGHDKTAAKKTTTAKLDSKATKHGSADVGANDHADTTAPSDQPATQVEKSPSGVGARTTEQSGELATGSETTITTTEPPAETGSAAAPPPTNPTPPTPPAKSKTGKRPASSGSTLGGKQVVLEDDNQARDAKVPAPTNLAKSDQNAITKARSAYTSGNQRLFAGDPEGAIKFYRQALAYYPAYVAGYRGLGLAYAQQGNKAQALQAFKTYVSSVPNAKDAALIRKRIASLSH